MKERVKFAHEKRGPQIVREDLETEVDTIRIRTSRGKEIAFTLRPKNDTMGMMDKFLTEPDKLLYGDFYVDLCEIRTHEDVLRQQLKGNNEAPRHTTIFHQAWRWKVGLFEAMRINQLAWDGLIEMYDKRDRQRAQ